MKIGVIGCGNMGGAMSSHLLGSGQDVVCFDPDSQVLNSMLTLGAVTALTAADLARQCSVIILSLPTSAVVKAVMSEIETDIAVGAVVLDTSTSVPATSQAMSLTGERRGFAFVDAPVSGGPAAANTGSMTMLLGGNIDAIERVRPVIELLTAKSVYVGKSGAGHAAKIANNMLCAANLVLVSEAVRLGEAVGIDAKDLLQGVNAGSGRSGVSEVNFPKWILNEAFDSGFTMGLMRKDVGLALDLARTTGVDLSGFAAIADIWLSQSDQLDDTADFNKITTR